MTDTPQVINTLRTKADNLAGYIGKLESDLAQARAQTGSPPIQRIFLNVA